MFKWYFVFILSLCISNASITGAMAVATPSQSQNPLLSPSVVGIGEYKEWIAVQWAKPSTHDRVQACSWTAAWALMADEHRMIHLFVAYHEQLSYGLKQLDRFYRYWFLALAREYGIDDLESYQNSYSARYNSHPEAQDIQKFNLNIQKSPKHHHEDSTYLSINDDYDDKKEVSEVLDALLEDRHVDGVEADDYDEDDHINDEYLNNIVDKFRLVDILNSENLHQKDDFLIKNNIVNDMYRKVGEFVQTYRNMPHQDLWPVLSSSDFLPKIHKDFEMVHTFVSHFEKIFLDAREFKGEDPKENDKRIYWAFLTKHAVQWLADARSYISLPFVPSSSAPRTAALLSLLFALNDEAPRVRMAALDGLRVLKDFRSLPHLVEQAFSSQDFTEYNAHALSVSVTVLLAVEEMALPKEERANDQHKLSARLRLDKYHERRIKESRMELLSLLNDEISSWKGPQAYGPYFGLLEGLTKMNPLSAIPYLWSSSFQLNDRQLSFKAGMLLSGISLCVNTLNLMDLLWFHGSFAIKKNALLALEKMGSSWVVPELMRLLVDPSTDPRLKPFIMRVLRQSGDEKILEDILVFAFDNNYAASDLHINGLVQALIGARPSTISKEGEHRKGMLLSQKELASYAQRHKKIVYRQCRRGGNYTRDPEKLRAMALLK